MFAVPGDAAIGSDISTTIVIFTGKSPTLKYLDRILSYAAPGDGCFAFIKKTHVIIPQPFDDLGRKVRLFFRKLFQ